MNMALSDFVAGVLLGTLLTLPLWPDQCHKGRTVNFWVWIYRKLDELISGEKG